MSTFVCDVVCCNLPTRRLDVFVHEERPTVQLELILDFIECVQVGFSTRASFLCFCVRHLK